MSTSGRKPPRRQSTRSQRQRSPSATSQNRFVKPPPLAGTRKSATQKAKRHGAGAQRTGTRRQGTTTQRLARTNAPVRPRWQRWLRTALAWGFTGTFILATIAFAGLAIYYQRLPVPTAADFAQAEASTIYYADGISVIGRLGVVNREVVSISDLPEYVGHAIVAAEDRTFYSNPGIDIMGTARAMFKTIVQGDRQGGSTITQQYVERYYVGETTTDIPGKIEEALLALKIDQQEDKTEILENYMNTIYFGRGAYGIQAASREYFGHPAKSLTVAEAALLAGIVPAPSAWDPRLDPDQAEFRWNYVLDGMVEGGWLTPAERLRLDFPAVIEYRNENVYGGPDGYILRAALEEVSERTGLSIEEIESQGYSIVTTIDQRTQRAAVNAAASIASDHSPNLRAAIVTINPENGAISAMYGGADYLTIQRNAVTQDVAQAGSTFKPFGLIAALESGMALEQIYNGDSGQRIEGFDTPVANFRNVDYGNINLIDATAFSVNNVYVQVARDVGPEKVLEVAKRAGLPEATLGLEANPSNVLGTASPHPIDMASAFATFAEGGVATEPYLVSAVYRSDGSIQYEHEGTRDRVFASNVMVETTYAMQQVVLRGSGVYASRLDRPIAGKTGTSNGDKSAWFVGFTPQIVGAVALYQVGDDGSAESITPFGGFREVTGGTVPVRLWTTMMAEVFEGMPVEAFPARSFIGEVVEPSPEPSPSPSPEPVVTPSPTPSASPSALPAPTEGPTPSATFVPEPELSVSPGAP